MGAKRERRRDLEPRRRNGAWSEKVCGRRRRMERTAFDPPGSDMTHNRADPLSTLLLAGDVVGGVAFLAVALSAGAFRRDYSALHQPVSLLSVGPDGWVQIANFVVTRVLMVGCGVGLRRALAGC
jgi:Protein of unknown function (DUF998)